MRAATLSALAVALFAAVAAHGQCSTAGRSKVNTPSDVTVINVNVPNDTAVQGAIADWDDASCNPYGVGFPMFHLSEGGVANLYVQYDSGISQTVGECGSFSGSTITLYEHAFDQFNQLHSCTENGLLQANLEHEIGHFLGLGHSGCGDHIMANIHFDANGNANYRWLHSDECQEADDQNTTPVECRTCQYDPRQGGCIVTR